ncbi:hypothetical protein CF319_g8995 [Tilletia indica]|nr:hypothetical protein CF319_g8995 [Tilletia indica]
MDVEVEATPSIKRTVFTTSSPSSSRSRRHPPPPSHTCSSVVASTAATSRPLWPSSSSGAFNFTQTTADDEFKSAKQTADDASNVTRARLRSANEIVLVGDCKRIPRVQKLCRDLFPPISPSSRTISASSPSAAHSS